MAFKDWSTTASDNDDADAAINWAEGQPPSSVNGSSRQMMATLKTALGHIVSAKDQGAVGDGSTDDAAVLATALTAATGYALVLETGKTYRSTAALTVPANTILDLNGSTIDFQGTGSVKCLDMRSGSVVRNGTISNTGASPAGSGEFQCPILVGNYAAGTGYNNVIIENVSVTNNRSDGNGIMVTGDSHNVHIRNVLFPDSTTLGRAILVHWGGATDPTAGTWHPRNIKIENIHVGQFTTSSLGQAIVFLSGCFGISVENVRIKECRRAAVTVYAGDYGFYYSQSEYKDLALTGIRISNVVSNLSTFAGFTVDGQAPSAPGTPIYDCDVTFQNCSSQGDKGAGVSNGFTVSNAYNVAITDSVAHKHLSGVSTGAAVRNLRVSGGHFYNNRLNGISFSNGTTAPIGCIAAYNYCHENGENGSSTNRTGVLFGAAVDCVAIGNRCGVASDSYQFYGIVSGGTAGNMTKVIGNKVDGVASGGVAYLRAPNSTTFDATGVFEGNTAASGITYTSGNVYLDGTASYNPGSLDDGAGETTTVTVTGAVLGDVASASFSLDLQGITLTAWVSSSDTVSVRLQNETTGTLNLGSGTLRARVRKA